MKHAYLIMAHNDFYILEKLLRLLDDKNNDIYIHIDKKVKNFDFDYYKNFLTESNLFYTDRLDIRWGNYKMIECEYLLFEEAYKKHYDYYHLLSGVDLPLVSQEIIHSFFEKNNGKEFISFDMHKAVSDSALDRIKYYHLFSSYVRDKNVRKSNFFNKIYYRLLTIQRKIGVNRLKKMDISIRKGANWVSVTDELVGFILSKKGFIRKHFKHSRCADELFLQTLVFNSDFYKNVYSFKDDNYDGIKRCIDWNRGEPYTFKKEDFEFLKQSNCFWARKFSTSVDKEIVDMIYNDVKEAKNA